jgi:hypothetical protein
VLDKPLTDDKIEWYCNWVKGGDPDRRLRVDEDIPLGSFLETVKSIIKNKSEKEGGVYRIGILTILAQKNRSKGSYECDYRTIFGVLCV